MKTLELLEMTINNLAYAKAMERVQKRKIKTWDRVEQKLEQYFKEERDKIIINMVENNTKG